MTYRWSRQRPNRIVLLLLILLTGSAPLAAASMVTDELVRAGHLLNRAGYGPSPTDLAIVRDIGVEAYIAEQLQPQGIDESGNAALLDREEALFTWQIPSRDTTLIATGALWRYRKGTEEPDPGWKGLDFDASAWLLGATGIGYDDGDDQTVLDDMRRDDAQGIPGYVSVYLRYEFNLTATSLTAISDLILRVDYDDGFRAYLNGVEVARANLPTGDVTYDTTATGSHEAGSAEDFDISAHAGLLVVGNNVLAIQAHNRSLTSSDFSIIPELLSREVLAEPARWVIRDVDALQQLVHIRGVYSQRQLQTVLAEFWENHFTTDYDKLVDYLDALQNSDAGDAMSREQAQAEAAQLEYQEYQFFYDNALGHFGDLLLYSATSPTMLVYLDNVLNVKGKANENYAREILELHTFGVDNRYTQRDIEQLARCFTGWAVCKIPSADARSFPASALEPPAVCGVQVEDTTVLDLGAIWRYFKGTEEPAPDASGGATTAWAHADFNDDAWLAGPTGIGYNDGDDATILSDMQGNYRSVYLRRSFTVRDASDFANLILEIAYDDGFVAYLNGSEVARSVSMEDTGTPPTYDQEANDNHEADEGAEYYNLSRFGALLQPGENVIAIQVHNTSLSSSDLSILPRLLDRTTLPGSVENGDRNAVWTFSFHPEWHDTAAKVLFADSEYEMTIPAGRTEAAGLTDALDVIDELVRHRSTAEFIGVKLIQKFVSDEITLATYHDGTAPTELRDLLDDVITAWNATEPAGHIATVMQTILDPTEQANPFWSERAYRGKVKTPIEYINSSLRVLGAEASGARLPQRNSAMGMELFVRDDPDGYSELGSDWIDTASMLERIEFVTDLAGNDNGDYRWDAAALLEMWNLTTPEQIVDFFDEMLFQRTLSKANKALLMDYLTTDSDGQPSALDPTDTTDYQRRVQKLVGLILSLPQWHFQ